MRARCMWCKEELRFVPGRGWVHLDGELYRSRKRLVWEAGAGMRTTDPELAAAWDKYGYRVREFEEEVDDHCATPYYD